MAQGRKRNVLGKIEYSIIYNTMKLNYSFSFSFYSLLSRLCFFALGAIIIYPSFIQSETSAASLDMQQAMMSGDRRKVHGYNEVLDKQPPMKPIKSVNSEYQKKKEKSRVTTARKFSSSARHFSHFHKLFGLEIRAWDGNGSFKYGEKNVHDCGRKIENIVGEAGKVHRLYGKRGSCWRHGMWKMWKWQDFFSKRLIGTFRIYFIFSSMSCFMYRLNNIKSTIRMICMRACKRLSEVESRSEITHAEPREDNLPIWYVKFLRLKPSRLQGNQITFPTAAYTSESLRKHSAVNPNQLTPDSTLCLFSNQNSQKLIPLSTLNVSTQPEL